MKTHILLFTTFVAALAFAGCGSKSSFTDPRDGQTYKTVKIGNQVWMAENLNYKTANSYCYEDKPANCHKYGRLYTWAAAMDSAGIFSNAGKGCGSGVTCGASGTIRGVCPRGWHLPSDAEWEILFGSVGGKDVAGMKLKSKSGWYDDEGESSNGTDEYGFSVLQADFRFCDGYYHDDAKVAYFWASTYSGHDAYGLFFYAGTEGVYSGYHDKNDGFSVRCLRDSD